MLRSNLVINAQHSCGRQQYLHTKPLNYTLTISNYCNILAFGLNDKKTFLLL